VPVAIKEHRNPLVTSCVLLPSHLHEQTESKARRPAEDCTCNGSVCVNRLGVNHCATKPVQSLSMCVCVFVCVLAGCKRQLNQCPEDDPDTMVNAGCVLYKEGSYEAARAKFTSAMDTIGYQVRSVGSACRQLLLARALLVVVGYVRIYID